MKKIFSVALGIVTSIGGYLDVGSIATSAQAGASYGFQLLWVLGLGTIMVVFLVEMSGRLAAVSKHPLAGAVRERLGIGVYTVTLVAQTLITWLVLTAEMGGVAIALQLVTGISFQVWAVPVGFALWLLLWRASFDLIENGVALLGLVTLSFVAAVFVLHPSWSTVAAGFLPSLPHDRPVHYAFLAVSMMGATIAPYLLYFYSSGAVEDDWDESYLGANRAIAGVGMGFGGLVAAAVLIAAGLVLQPKGIQADNYAQVALTLIQPFGLWGLILFALSLGIACFGASLEVSLNGAYFFAQGFGWNWGESAKPREAARFATVYTLLILFSTALLLVGIDPLRLTLLSMALTAVILPAAIAPLLLLLNDPDYVGKYRNGKLTNTVIIIVLLVAFVMAIVSIPLELFGG